MLEELQRNEWLGGQLLAFSGLDGETDYARGLVARTGFGELAIEVKLPARCRVQFSADVSGPYYLAGDWFQVGNRVRGAFVDAHHLRIDGSCTVSGVEEGLKVLQQGGTTLVGTAECFDETLQQVPMENLLHDRQRWLAQRCLPDGLSETARRTLWKVLSQMKTQVYSPEGLVKHRWTTPDRWPHRQMWLWDSAFHAIGFRHFDPTLAREAILAVLDMQREDGFIAHMMSPDAMSDITQPPVLALGVKLVNDVAPDADWLAEVYPKLCRYLRWDMAHRDRDGAGLLEWDIEGDPFCRSGESGMDNSPRFDAATAMDATDFNSFLALECEILAEMSSALGRSAEAMHWQSEYERVCSLIRDRLWSERHQFFVDYDVEKNAASDVLASSGFLPLICGAATPAQAAALVAALKDPEMFGTAFPVPSIAFKDRSHYVKDMWRGPVWINLNWLIASGLDRYGYSKEATSLRARTMEEIERHCEKYGTLFEFYDDRGDCDPPQLLRKGRCAPEMSPYHQVLHDYGWTATLYADLAFTKAR